MLIHPTLKYVPCSRSKSRHASPNHHSPDIMLQGMLDMLKSNTFSISNRRPWPTILVKFIYLCLVTINHAFPNINGPIFKPLSKLQACKSMFTTHKRFPLLHLCTQSNLSQSTPHSDDNQQFPYFRSKLFCCHICSFKSTFSNKSDTSSLGLQEALDTLLFISQSRPHPSWDALQTIDSCSLKRQLCE